MIDQWSIRWCSILHKKDKMDTIQISNISVEEFKEIIKNSFEQIRIETPILNSNDNKEKYATRKEVAKALHISLPTLNELTKSGILIGYRIQGRVLYKWIEVDQALTRIESIKYKRGQ